MASQRSLAVPADSSETAGSGLEECFAHTDLEWRLKQIPDSHAVRGVFMNMLDERAAEFGPVLQAKYRDFFQTYKFSAIQLYPVKDYLTRLVKLSQLQFGGPNIYQGLFDIQAAAFPAWRKSLPGRVMFAVMGSEFHSVLKTQRRAMQSCINHGTFEVKDDRPGHYICEFRDQPNYIQYAMLGALTGVARVCGVDVKMDVELKDPFNGDIHITVLGPATTTAA